MNIILLTLAVFFLSGCDTPAMAQVTDGQLAMAIYHIEGGRAAQYPFGIRSVACGSFNECKRVCLQTIKNNRLRFARLKNKGSQTYYDYLARRYCPRRGRALTPAERRLNRFWAGNLKSYLWRHYHEKVSGI